MLETMLPLLGTPYMVNRFHANGGLKQMSSKVIAFQLEISNRTPRCQQTLEQLATSRPDCPATGWHPAETRLPEAITGGGCSTTTLLRIRRLRLLSSNNICYLNTVALAWLHATARIGCSEHVAFGDQIQAWRDLLYSKRTIHVHVLPSWCSILSSWQDVQRQHDAGEMLEHWVAAGRHPVVKGRWEARVETPQSWNSGTTRLPHRPSKSSFPNQILQSISSS